MTPCYFLTKLPTADIIVEKMTRPDLIYHNLSHAVDLANLAFIDAGSINGKWLTFQYYCAFYHDIIYTQGRKDNESESADMFLRHIDYLNTGPFPMTPEMSKDIFRCINLSANHFAPEAYTSHSWINDFLDYDLMGLCSEPEIYDLNTAKIRAENIKADEAAWYKGRTGFLRMALGVPNIYRKESYIMEKKARSNMARELFLLEGKPYEAKQTA